MNSTTLQISVDSLPEDLKKNRRKLGRLKGDITKIKNSALQDLENLVSSRLSHREGKYYRRNIEVTDHSPNLGFTIGIDTSDGTMRRLEYGYKSFYLWDKINPAKAKRTKKDNKIYYDIPFKYYLLRNLNRYRPYTLYDRKKFVERSPHLFLVGSMRASRFREATEYNRRGTAVAFTPYKSTTKTIPTKFKGSEFRFSKEMAATWRERGYETVSRLKAEHLLGGIISGTVQTIKRGPNAGKQRMIYTHLVVFRRMDETNKGHFFIKGRRGLRAISTISKKIESELNKLQHRIAGG